MFKRCLPSLLVLAIFGGAAWAQDAPKLEFKEFTSEAGKFTASFPGTVAEKTNEIPVEGGNKLKLFLFTVEVNKNLAYMVTYVDYPDSVKTTEPQKVLQGVRDGNKGTDGKMVKDDTIKYGKKEIPGRDLLIDKGTYHYRAKIILAGTRLYQVVIVGSKDDVAAKDADLFFESLKLAE
jgi:hypothetical protein